jgi:hypothetical protein
MRLEIKIMTTSYELMILHHDSVYLRRYNRMLRLSNAHTEYAVRIGWESDHYLNRLWRAERMAIGRLMGIRERLLAKMRKTG